MPLAKGLRGGALICLAAFGFNSSGSAEPTSDQREAAVAVEARERETNESLLQALIARRAEVERAADTAGDKRALLDLIDKRIAEVRSRIK
jgi:hypothetical protein